MNFCERLTGEDLLEFHQQIVLGFTSEEEVWSTMVPNDLPMDLGKDFFIYGRNCCQTFRPDLPTWGLSLCLNWAFHLIYWIHCTRNAQLGPKLRLHVCRSKITVLSIYKEVHDLGGTGIGQPTMGPAGGFVTGNGGLDSSGLMATPIDDPAMSTNPCKFHLYMNNIRIFIICLDIKLYFC